MSIRFQVKFHTQASPPSYGLGWRGEGEGGEQGEDRHAAISRHTLNMREQSRLVIGCPNLSNLSILVYLVYLTLP